MTDMPRLTDSVALAQHSRSARTADLFLHRAAVDEVEDRLSLVNKSFTDPAVVTPFPQPWRDALPGARIVPDDDTLALQPGAHDLVVHAMALHWANDPVGQMIQCRRALRPDGLFIALCLGGRTLEQLRACLPEAEIAETGGLSPRVAPMAEIRDLGGLLQRSGFALPVADTVKLTATYASPLDLMRDLRAMGEASALSGR